MAGQIQTINSIKDTPYGVFGKKDPMSSETNGRNKVPSIGVMEGIVVQFNVGMYSALVHTESRYYICSVGTFNTAPGFGYSDAIVLREGDRVIFTVLCEDKNEGVILARRPVDYSKDDKHPVQVQSDTKLERRTSFFSNDCYRKTCQAYDTPLKNPKDISTARFMNNRPTDLVPGEVSSINQHHCGMIRSIYSTTIMGGGAYVKMFALENRIRVVADSIIRHTLFGNEEEWHNRRYLSREKGACMYQEERLGLKSKQQPAYEKSDYDSEFYFIKNKKKKQTQNPRTKELEGYFGNMSSRYVLRPDPDRPEVRVMDEELKDPGVMRESVDPSGQYRMAATGMLGFERIGRIPVPIRVRYPWHDKAEEPPAKKLEEFKHAENHPYYRQLELADRVAYDQKNSYARLDEAETEFYTPEEQDLEKKLEDIYDPGFTDSKTVKLEKYDKRRSGMWQGEDGSIIIRDAWGSEIVMIGGNIQFSCAGNIEILPGKTALTIAGDDIVHKAQNSVDIESADKDVRINAFKNLQLLAGVDDDHPGGITIEAKGEAFPWDADIVSDDMAGGESIETRGVVIKSPEKGAVSVYGGRLILRSEEKTSIVSGRKPEDAGEGDLDIAKGGGEIYMSAASVMEYGHEVEVFTDEAALMLENQAFVVADSVFLAGRTSAAVMQGKEFMVPLMWAEGDKNVADEVLNDLDEWVDALRNELVMTEGFTQENMKKMHFKFRSSLECWTIMSWEIDDMPPFKLYEPFWIQITKKFETLKNVKHKSFDDHVETWGEPYGHPWPGTKALDEAKYAELESLEPLNLDEDGFNKPRKGDELKKESPVIEIPIFPGYQIRED